jgi:outer membrane protein assembly factor BamB
MLVTLQALFRFAVPVLFPETGPLGTLGSMLCGLGVVVWWAFFSRASGSERLAGVALMIAALVASRPLMHPSIATGMMGMMFFIYAIPVVSFSFVIWAVATRGLSDRIRHASMVATVLLACGAWALLRTDGITGEGASQLAWRWSETHEARLLAKAAREPEVLPASVESPAAKSSEPVAEPPVQAPETVPAIPAARATAPLSLPEKIEPAAEWPGFRGAGRDGVVRGVRIQPDWSSSQPVELWRRPVGPGWSSFAVDGDLFYTQEQRGSEEIVGCYRVTTGAPVWAHRDTARFWESNAGAGPRGTPTLDRGCVYTFGATGIVNALDAKKGTVLWSHNAAADTDTKTPGWGFSSSPLVVEDVVIVAVSGKLVAYDLASGKRRWDRPSGGGSYSSPQLATIDGVPQVILLSGAGAMGVSPKDGTVLWQHAWPGTTIVQPALAPEGDVLISTSDMSGGVGIRRIRVSNGSSGWTVEERWTSAGLKPYFNDFVVHKGHAFGFDGRILSCIDLQDGKRKWKGGRYGNGQLVLLSDQDLLLVLSEEGELILVKASPEEFAEVARVPAIQGKTWNHPVLVGNVLLVRNGEEMAAFRLPAAGR